MYILCSYDEIKEFMSNDLFSYNVTCSFYSIVKQPELIIEINPAINKPTNSLRYVWFIYKGVAINIDNFIGYLNEDVLNHFIFNIDIFSGKGSFK